MQPVTTLNKPLFGKPVLNKKCKNLTLYLKRKSQTIIKEILQRVCIEHMTTLTTVIPTQHMQQLGF